MKMKTIAQQLNITKFPFKIKDSNGREIYLETSHGFWEKREFDSNGRGIYYETSKGYWEKREFDSNAREFYYENSKGYWEKREWDSNGGEIYWDTSNGTIGDNRPKKELTMNEIADKFGIPVSELKIKKD